MYLLLAEYITTNKVVWENTKPEYDNYQCTWNRTTEHVSIMEMNSTTQSVTDSSGKMIGFYNNNNNNNKKGKTKRDGGWIYKLENT